MSVNSSRCLSIDLLDTGSTQLVLRQIFGLLSYSLHSPVAVSNKEHSYNRIFSVSGCFLDGRISMYFRICSHVVSVIWLISGVYLDVIHTGLQQKEHHFSSHGASLFIFIHIDMK